LAGLALSLPCLTRFILSTASLSSSRSCALEGVRVLALTKGRFLSSSRTKLALLSLISSKTFIVFFIMPEGCSTKLLHFFERNP